MESTPEPYDDFRPVNGWVFFVGLLLYLLGFAFLAQAESLFAPFAIVGGILVMLLSFVIDLD